MMMMLRLGHAKEFVPKPTVITNVGNGWLPDLAPRVGTNPLSDRLPGDPFENMLITVLKMSNKAVLIRTGQQKRKTHHPHHALFIKRQFRTTPKVLHTAANTQHAPPHHIVTLLNY